MRSEGSTPTLLVWVQTCRITLESNLAIYRKTENGFIPTRSYTTPWHILKWCSTIPQGCSVIYTHGSFVCKPGTGNNLDDPQLKNALRKCGSPMQWINSAIKYKNIPLQSPSMPRAKLSHSPADIKPTHKVLVFQSVLSPKPTDETPLSLHWLSKEGHSRSAHGIGLSDQLGTGPVQYPSAPRVKAVKAVPQPSRPKACQQIACLSVVLLFLWSQAHRTTSEKIRWRDKHKNLSNSNKDYLAPSEHSSTMIASTRYYR